MNKIKYIARYFSLLFMLLITSAAWGQTDYSGVYYIKHNAAPTYYLCTSTVFYDGNHYANSGDMPYLTTATESTITNDGVWDKDAVWRIIKAESGDYYYVVHAVDGKYLTTNDDPTDYSYKDGNRLSLHLQYLKDEEKSLFKITKSGSWYNISPKSKDIWSLNPAGNNFDTRAGDVSRTQKIGGQDKGVGGIIGLWANDNTNSKWQFQAVTDKPICDAPIFTYNGTLSISCSTDGATIYYTTDGSTIPTTSSNNGNSVNVTQDIDVVWARATTQDSEPFYWSPLSVYNILRCAKPVISVSGGTVTITCATEGATIHYTTDGSPATASSTTYSEPFAKGDISTIRAVATKAGYYISREAALLPPTEVSSSDEITDMMGNYMLAAGFSSTSSIGTSGAPFKGTIDGNMATISSLNHPLVAYANGATIKNVILDNVTIDGNDNGNAGAICAEATGDTRIYNCGVKSGTISGTNAGSIVGKLDDNSRVINCYSFATVSGGTWGAGIVGYNSISSTRSDLRTMVMNCMFYGEISSGTNISPIYGGNKITNVSNLNGYNYYRFDADYSRNNNITAYNCALAAEEKYLTRFEFFRNILNSNRELAAWYATGDPSEGKGIGNACKIAKWVLDPADKPYPILKTQGYYPSVINYEDAPNLGTIDLTINESNTTAGGQTKPTGASINSNYPTTLTVYDKDLTHKHFNYRTVRLPYYNEVGTGNCTKNKVVTGWKITGFSGGTQGHFVNNTLDYSGTTHGEGVYPPYNFADRYCTDKDKFSVSGRIFSQGAYYDVPEGVTGITIEPYWGTAVYLSDPTYDVAYPKGYGNNNTNAVFVSNMGDRYVNGNTASINGDNQTVYTTYSNAFGQIASSGTVYDNAIVLVGNYHHYWGPNSPSTTKAFTIMSADFNNDCEPDYGFIVQHGTNRQDISAIRFDFINSPGLGMIQKVETDKAIPKHGIWCPKGWFEVTNTTLIQFTQFEYDKGGKSTGSPLILLGGIYDQFITARQQVANSTEYIHLGSNIWMKEFCNGVHTNASNSHTTRHIPISVTGGEFESFYLTGTFRPSVNSVTDNAECYINGGKFGDMAGAGQEQLKGDVTWLIDHADITNFYGGGINGQKPITGNIYVEINNSQVGLYCGGPKFGNMQANKKVTTKAKGSTFGNFYGAGYGGTSYFRDMTRDVTGGSDWDTYVGDYTRKFVSGKGISTEYEYEFIPYSGGQSGQADYVGRFYVLYASLSLAETKNVESTLEDCHITGSFYGGGKLGRVDGDITSTLKNCFVDENVFGAGFSASVEKVNVVSKGAKMNPNPDYNESVGVFTDGVYPDGEEYTWTHAASVSEGNEFDDTNKYIYTTVDLTTLGSVTGNVTLNIEGTTTVNGDVYGGGEESGVGGDTEVNVKGGTIGTGTADSGNVFGGGNLGIVEHNTTVNISGGSVNNSIYGGGCEADVKGNTNVSMTDGYVFNGIFGGGLSGSVGTFTRSTNPSDVNIFGHTAHEGCIGKPISCAENTGKCTVVVSGGQIGPIEVATQGMNRLDAQGGPVPEGWVWGGGRGLVQSPTENPDVHFTAYVNETDVTIKDNAFILESIIGGGEFGRVLGNTKVKIEGGQIGVGANQTKDGKPIRYSDDKFVNPSVTPITNENALEPCSHYQYGKTVGTTTVYETYDPYADKYKQDNEGAVPTGLEGGSTDNASDGKTWIGCVFGGGSGYFPYKETDTDGKITDYGWVESAGLVEGNTELIISGGHILSNVYGANEYTTVQGKSTVTMTGGTIGVPRTQAQIEASPKLGHLFGGGKGDPRPYFKNKTNVGSVEIDISGGFIYGSVYGGGESGTVKGGVAVNMTGGVVLSDVYGGGALADTQTSNWDASANENAGDWTDAENKSALHTTNVRLTGGTIVGNAYGGGLGDAGKPACVWGNVLVELNKDDFVADNAKGCVVLGSIFGCNNLNGTPMGDVMVHIYKTQNNAATRITNAPASGGNSAVEDAKVKGRYDIAAVYGGGNQSAYEPADLENNKTEVIIDGCERTSIRQVYGGGNAACTPATNVTVNGTFEVEELFGGGNGKDDIPINGVDMPNPGANVGYKNYSEYYVDEKSGLWMVRDMAAYDTKEKRTAATDPETGIVYGTGRASVNIFGGLIHRVFGGSNTKGNVRQTALTLLDENSGCTFCVDEAYGGGKEAEMDAEGKLLMACIPGLDAVYGGAEAADVKGGVTLNITNGTFGRVFGGNNISGTICGPIKVNIKEVGCKPIIIGELYGGGNQAAYSVYGYDSDNKPKESGSNPWADPEVNVTSFTSIGEIYGGGYGTRAVMVGNPKVSINEAIGTPATYPTTGDFDNTGFKGKTFTFDVGKETEHTVTCPAHVKGKMGSINKVFGGGNAAQVKGDTYVNIGTTIGDVIYEEVDVEAGVTIVTNYYIRSGTTEPYTYVTPSQNAGTCDADGKAVTGKTYYRKFEIKGANIIDNVYGGGNNAEVTGKARVQIGKKILQ